MSDREQVGTEAGGVWDRACRNRRGSFLQEGDLALAAIVLVHGLVMNGGVLHAVGCLHEDDVVAACDGFRYYGFPAVAELLEEARTVVTAGHHIKDKELNAAYAAVVPNDQVLRAAFEHHFATNGSLYAPGDKLRAPGVAWRPMRVRCKSWSVVAGHYRRVYMPEPALRALQHLCEHVERSPYRHLVFCATSMHTLLVSQHPELEWNCNVLRIDPTGKGDISFTMCEQPFVAPAEFHCSPGDLIETFETFLRKYKWVSEEALRPSSSSNS